MKKRWITPACRPWSADVFSQVTGRKDRPAPLWKWMCWASDGSGDDGGGGADGEEKVLSACHSDPNHCTAYWWKRMKDWLKQFHLHLLGSFPSTGCPFVFIWSADSLFSSPLAPQRNTCSTCSFNSPKQLLLIKAGSCQLFRYLFIEPADKEKCKFD